MTDHNISSMLQEDVEDVEREIKISMIIGGVLVLVTFAYLQWAYSNVSHMLNPEELASAAVGYAEGQITDLTSTAVTDGTARAQEIVAGGYETVAGGITSMRVELETTMRDADADFGKQTDIFLRDYFDRFVGQNPQIKLAVSDDPKLAAKAMAAVAKDMRVEMEGFFQDQVDEHLAESRATVADLRKRLEKYAANSGLTVEEKEERDLLIAWFQFAGGDIGKVLKLDGMKDL